MLTHSKKDQLQLNEQTQLDRVKRIRYLLEEKRFTEITVHRGSVVTIRFTILFLQVSIRFGSLKCKQKLSINC